VTFMFFVAGFIGAYLVIKMRSKKNSPYVISLVLFSLEQVLLVASIIIGMMGDRNIRDAPIELGSKYLTEAVYSNFLGVSLSMAMGIQCICVQSMIKGAPSTTVITSSIVHIAENFANSMFFKVAPSSCCTTAPTSESRVNAIVNGGAAELWMIKMSVCLKSFVLFAVGAVLGGAASFISLNWCLLAPIGLILFLQIEITLQLMHTRQTELAKWKCKQRS